MIQSQQVLCDKIELTNNSIDRLSDKMDSNTNNNSFYYFVGGNNSSQPISNVISNITKEIISCNSEQLKMMNSNINQLCSDVINSNVSIALVQNKADLKLLT